jgi:hypothetical protein
VLFSGDGDFRSLVAAVQAKGAAVQAAFAALPPRGVGGAAGLGSACPPSGVCFPGVNRVIVRVGFDGAVHLKTFGAAGRVSVNLGERDCIAMVQRQPASGPMIGRAFVCE